MKMIFMMATILATQAQTTSPSTFGTPCADSKVQAQRSRELQKIREADQADRTWQAKGEQPTQKVLEKMSRNDLTRRKRVGEIFGEGCLTSAADYEAAFIVYQHGNTPDQYFQAFLWSRQAMELGNAKIKGEVAMSVDRYLISIGRKQLFGTQAFQEKLGDCWCIQPVEDSFPQSLRDKYRNGANAASTGLPYLKILNARKDCPTSYCQTSLQPSHQGTIPGFW